MSTPSQDLWAVHDQSPLPKNYAGTLSLDHLICLVAQPFTKLGSCTTSISNPNRQAYPSRFLLVVSEKEVSAC
jgi:hypothetical protein